MGSACSKGHPTRDLLTSVHLQYRLVRSMHQHFDDLYEVVEVIGEGSTSKISKIKRKAVSPNEDDDDMYFALKEIDLTMVRAEFLDELENEIKLLKALVSAQAYTSRTQRLSSTTNARHPESIHISEP
jgi:hypothetical protein